MKVKTVIAAILVTALCLGVLTACGGSDLFLDLRLDQPEQYQKALKDVFPGWDLEQQFFAKASYTYRGREGELQLQYLPSGSLKASDFSMRS